MSISRVIDTLLAFPGLLLAIALVAVLGPSLGNVLFALDDRRLGRVRAARARAGPARARVRLRAGGASARRRTPRVLWRHVVPAAHAGGRRAGDARHGGRDHRRGRAELPRARRPAADAELGHDAERGARAFAGRAAPDDLSRAWRLRCSCWASISSATACATSPTRRNSRVRLIDAAGQRAQGGVRRVDRQAAGDRRPRSVAVASFSCASASERQERTSVGLPPRRRCEPPGRRRGIVQLQRQRGDSHRPRHQLASSATSAL